MEAILQWGDILTDKTVFLRNVVHLCAVTLVFVCLAWSGTSLAQETAENMVLVDGGTFLMGDTLDKGFHRETPVRRVTVKSFFISKYEVTFDEYDDFCQSTGREKPKIARWERGQKPASCVSWFDAVDYCNWFSEREGLTPVYSGTGDAVACDFSANGYRLPTEAEWEYAARGGRKSGGYQYSGSDNAYDVAWYADNGRGYSHPVGEKLANELGLHDMSGNVMEWCWDWYGSYKNSATDNPTGPSKGNERVYRGGSFGYDRNLVRVSFRASRTPGYGDRDLGFRLARTSL